MIQSIIYKGNWRLPGATESYAGTLIFDPVNGGQLEIVGQFQAQWINTAIPVLIGSTTDGWITLLDTRRDHGQYSHVTQIGISIYKPSFIFVNHAFETAESISFRSVKFSLFNLLQWLTPKAINERWPKNNYILEYNRPDTIEFQCFAGCSGSIEFSLEGNYRNEYFDIQVVQKAEICLRYDQKKLYGNILADIFAFVRLLTFCTYEQSYPLTIEFSDDDLTDEFIEKRLKQTVPKKIPCFYQNGFYKPSYQQRKWHQHLVTFTSLKGELPSLIPLWFGEAEKLTQPIYLLLRFFVDKYDFSVERFMDIAKAMELFHRLNYTNGVMPKMEFQEWKKRYFSASLTKEELNWLKQKLAYANEPTLKSRLEDLVRDYAFPYFDKRVVNRGLFCCQTADSRNYYTHFDIKLKDKALKGKELFDLTENLKLLLLAAILRRLNIPIEAVNESVERLIY